MKYKIIIIAMKDELKPIKNQLKVNEKGDYQTGNTIIKISKIGKVNAAYTVTKSIYEYGKNNIKEIINIGTAGSINEPIGTIIKGSKYIYGDVDVTPFNYQLGQVPEMPEYYGKEGNLIITTDSFVTNIDNLKLSTEIKNKITNGEIKSINDFISYNINIRQFTQDFIESTSDATFVEHFYKAINKITIF
jgi:nucleoside phosphorylase